MSLRPAMYTANRPTSTCKQESMNDFVLNRLKKKNMYFVVPETMHTHPTKVKINLIDIQSGRGDVKRQDN